MKKTACCILFATISTFLVKSQDVHYSQFNENPALLNPGLTGISGVLRISLNNKDQWRSITDGYKTFGVNCELRFKPNNWEKIHKPSALTFKEKSIGRVATGISLYTDKAGDGNFGLTQVNLSLASFIPVSKNSLVSLGLQASLCQRKIETNKLIFPNQYNGTLYDPNQVSRENFSSTNFTYADFSAGFVWSYSLKENKSNALKQSKANIGFSVYHLNKPTQYFLLSASELSLKYIIHGNWLFTLPNSPLAISPAFLIQAQGPSSEFLIGTMIKHFLKSTAVKQNCIGYGLYYRNKDAVIVSGLLEWREQYTVIMSYDLNISSLMTASAMRGGFEITLRYTRS